MAAKIRTHEKIDIGASERSWQEPIRLIDILLQLFSQFSTRCFISFEFQKHGLELCAQEVRVSTDIPKFNRLSGFFKSFLDNLTSGQVDSDVGDTS